MREPYGEGLATHTGPESCAGEPRGRRRSVDRGTSGLGIEPRKTQIEAPTLCDNGEGNTDGCTLASSRTGLAWSETPCTLGSSTHGNREISRPAVGVRPWERGVSIRSVMSALGQKPTFSTVWRFVWNASVSRH